MRIRQQQKAGTSSKQGGEDSLDEDGLELAV
jgi:hypothetical protein